MLIHVLGNVQTLSTPSSQKTTTTESSYNPSDFRGDTHNTIRTTQPSLPLYHPQGTLALSLPELDPSMFGHPSSVTIDDNDIPIDDSDAGRRASGRSRRPAAKVRDRDREDGDASNINGNTNGQPNGQDNGANPSPKKRRAGPGGAGGKRRRKDHDDGDGTYPQPQRRTRNPRGVAAVTSPLSGPAVAADATGDTPATNGGQDVNDSHQDNADSQEPKPNTRARRPRNTRRRRGSSASETTSTSVSVSIATNARITRASNAKVGTTKIPAEEDVPQESTSQTGGNEKTGPGDVMDEDSPPDNVPETPAATEIPDLQESESQPPKNGSEKLAEPETSHEGEKQAVSEKGDKEEGEVSEGSS